jgi:hypothetical protein
MPGATPRTVCWQSPPERGEHLSNGCTPMRVPKMAAARAHAPALPSLTLPPTAPTARHLTVVTSRSTVGVWRRHCGGVRHSGRKHGRAWRRWSVVGLVLGIKPTGIALAQRNTAAALEAEVDRLYKAGKYAEATEIASRSSPSARRHWEPSTWRSAPGSTIGRVVPRPRALPRGRAVV